MSTETNSGRWLILEQNSDIAEWCSESSDGLVVRENGISLGRPKAAHEPQDSEICIYFLHLTGNGSVFPECFRSAGMKEWKLWCHYGGDRNPGMIRNAWNEYSRLSATDKQFLASPGQPPLPFSRSQPMAGSTAMNEVKKIVRNHRADWNREHWHDLQKALRSAWDLATPMVSIHEGVREAKAVLPALLAAEFIQQAVLFWEENASRRLEHFLQLLQRCGLISMSPSALGFSKEARLSFLRLGHAAVRGARMLKRARAEAKQRADNGLDSHQVEAAIDREVKALFQDEIRDSLGMFIVTCKEQSAHSTMRFKRNPNAPML